MLRLARLASFTAFCALLLAALPASAETACRGLKSAHCFCKMTIGNHDADQAGEQLITPPNLQGKDLFVYTIPNKCYNQAVDAVEHSMDKGCWKDCRDALGVKGARPDPGMTAATRKAQASLRGLGFCGGSVWAPTWFAAGTNKYKSDTGSDWKMPVGGKVVMQNGKPVCK
ncbi:MAG: hypothetical protein JST92_22780 [Deltaproteobacteria bacterium]|nr:hypothetical protein [Deltaproteobacteria bacterium]